MKTCINIIDCFSCYLHDISSNYESMLHVCKCVYMSLSHSQPVTNVFLPFTIRHSYLSILQRMTGRVTNTLCCTSCQLKNIFSLVTIHWKSFGCSFMLLMQNECMYCFVEGWKMLHRFS